MRKGPGPRGLHLRGPVWSAPLLASPGRRSRRRLRARGSSLAAPGFFGVVRIYPPRPAGDGGVGRRRATTMDAVAHPALYPAW